MPTDPNIILSGQQPQVPQLAQQLSALKTAGLNQQETQQRINLGQQDQQINQYKLADAGRADQNAQQQQAAQQATKDALARHTTVDPTTGTAKIDKTGVLSDLAAAGHTDMAIGLSSQWAAGDEAVHQQQLKDTADTLANHSKTLEQQGQIIGPYLKTVTTQSPNGDPQAWALAVNTLEQNGILKPGSIDPTKPNPALAQQVFGSGATVAEQMTDAQKKITDAQAASNAAETARHNRVDEGIQRTRANNENTGTLSVVQVPGDNGQPTSALLNNKTGKISPTNPGLTKPSATQPPAGQPTTADRNRSSLAQVALDNINTIEDIVKRRPELFGPGAGRISNIDQIIGSNDPDLVAVTNAAHNFSMANAGVHGSRSVQNVRDAVKDLLGDLHNGPQGIQGGLNANRTNLNSIITRGSSSKTAPAGNSPATYQKTATGAGGHKIGSNDGGSTWFDTQTGQKVQ